MIGLALLLFTAGMAVLGPSLTNTNPNQTNIGERLRPPVFAGGTLEHPLGTDQLGRDIVTRLLYGARVSLWIGFSSVLISLVSGVLLGLVTGYRGGFWDELIMRVGDAQLAIPFLVMVISIVAVLGPSLPSVILTLGLAGWIQFGRVVRARALSLREEEYVQAARVVGASDTRILFRHILPNVVPTIIVMTSFQFALMIIVESSLSFLGLGVPPPDPTWGGMVNDGRSYIQVAWWLITMPGLAITALVLGANFFGDWLRDVWDPRLRGVTYE